MKRNFVELQKFLEINYPELIGNVSGDLYPPPGYAMVVAQVAQVAQLGAMAVMMAGARIFQAMGMQQPAAVGWMQEHKLQTVMGTFMLNSLASNLQSTGAFEVSLDGELIFSKLATGQFPNGNNLVHELGLRGLRQS